MLGMSGAPPELKVTGIGCLDGLEGPLGSGVSALSKQIVRMFRMKT